MPHPRLYLLLRRRQDHFPARSLHWVCSLSPSLFSYTPNLTFHRRDTLFISGCGRIFEGTASEMRSSLSKLAQLPHDTVTYVGHEYTRANAAFAASVEPENADIKALAEVCKETGVVTTGRYTIGDELCVLPPVFFFYSGAGDC